MNISSISVFVLICHVQCLVQAALSSVDYEDYVRNETEIKEKMATIKKELKDMKMTEQITDKVNQKPS